MALPITACYALVVWLVSGVAAHDWWLQLACFVVSSFLMVELNNVNALIRIYSRMVSCSFLVLYCCANMLFPSLREALMTTCMAAAYLVLFQSYQNKQAVGITFYTFLLISAASIAFVQVLFFLPLIWLLMSTNLLSLSWRTWSASLLGLAVPYWFWACWQLWTDDLALLVDHFTVLGNLQFPANYDAQNLNQWLTFVFVSVLAIIGTIHYIRKSYLDKIRIRMFFGIFIWMDLLAAIFLVAQPQFYDAMLSMMLINTAPLAGHFLALTSTRITNAASIAIVAAALLLTAFNIWSTSLPF